MIKLSRIFSHFAKALITSVSLSAVAIAAVPVELPGAMGAIEAKIADARSNPARYAVPMSVPMSDVADAGKWLLQEQQAEWHLSIALPGALNISAGLSDLQLPAGAELWLSGGGVTQGPYTASRSSQLTAVVPGDDAELILRLPADQRDNFSFSELTLYYGFRSLGGEEMGSPRADDEPQTRSGTCLADNDVVCPAGNSWQDEIRAVARITVNNLLFCSAVLLNDTDQSLTPYLLTADHCGEDVGTDNGGFDNLDAVNTIAYWNFERSQCGGSNDGDLSQNQAGAVLRAANRDIDFALIELQSPPLPAFNVHWAGWDARGVGASSGAGIHHPDGREKIISLFSSSVRKSSPLSSLDANDYWRVVWSDGVTQGGSSGSGLWNEDRRVIGSLSRGLSECRTAENSGNGNPETFPDFYSAFDAAWLGDGTAGTQLSAWLDSGNTGILAMNGRDADSAAEPVPAGSDGNPGGDNGGGNSGGSGAAPASGGGGAPWLLLPLLLMASLQRRK